MARLTAALLALALCAGCGRPAPTFSTGPIAVSRVVAPVPVIGGPGGAYFTITNSGPADTLMSVTSPAADTVMIHEMGQGGGMTAAGAVVIPAGATVRFAPRERHVMLTGMHVTLTAGDTLPLVLHFARAGALPVTARVVDYAHLDEALGPPADR
jgi:copper(I)-binding protein